MRELPDIAEVREAYEELVIGVIPDDVLDRLYRLPAQVELDGVLYVHGSPLSDVESFAPQPEPAEERMLAGVRDRTWSSGTATSSSVARGRTGPTS